MIALSLLTDERLNILKDDGSSDPDVWAIGDAAMTASQPLPATAQGAIRLVLVQTISMNVSSRKPEGSLPGSQAEPHGER